MSPFNEPLWTDFILLGKGGGEARRIFGDIKSFLHMLMRPLLRKSSHREQKTLKQSLQSLLLLAI